MNLEPCNQMKIFNFLQETKTDLWKFMAKDLENYIKFYSKDFSARMRSMSSFIMIEPLDEMEQ